MQWERALGVPIVWSPYIIMPIHCLMVWALPQRSSVTIQILSNAPSAHQVSLPSWSGHCSPSVFLAQYSDCFSLSFLHLHFRDCVNGTLFSLWWSVLEFRYCQPPCSRFIACDDPHSKCVKCLVFCMSAKRFTAHLNINSVKTSVSKPSTQGLRFLKSRHPFSPLRSGSRQGPPWIRDLGFGCGARGDGERADGPRPFLSLSHLNPRADSPVEVLHDYLCLSPEVRKTISFGLEEYIILYTVASDRDSQLCGRQILGARPFIRFYPLLTRSRHSVLSHLPPSRFWCAAIVQPHSLSTWRMGNTLGFLPLPPVPLSPAAHVVGDVCGYLPEPEEPVPVTDQALTSVPVGFLIPHQDARGSPSWWMMLSPRDNLSTQVCPLDCNTLLYHNCFTNGSVYQGYRLGFSEQFSSVTHFSSVAASCGRLVCHCRPEGCLFSYSDPSATQQVPQVRLWVKGLPVQGSSLWLVLALNTFTKCMDAALAPLTIQGIRILSDLDDWLI